MLENAESQEMYLATIYALQKKNGMVRLDEKMKRLTRMRLDDEISKADYLEYK